MSYKEFKKEIIKNDIDDPISCALLFLMFIDGKIELNEEEYKKVIENAKLWLGEEYIKTKIREQEDEEGGWEDFESYVNEGDEGEFVLQEHERGLTEKQAKSGRRYEGEENIHCDLRFHFKNNDFLIGITLATPGKAHGKNKIVEQEGKTLIVGVKKRQPLTWLDVGKGKDLFKSGVVDIKLYGNQYKADLSMAGQVGSTAYTWSRFVAIDYGKVKAGKQEKHFKEFFFDGKYAILKGRWIIQGVPVEEIEQTGIEGRVWFFSKTKEKSEG